MNYDFLGHMGVIIRCATAMGHTQQKVKYGGDYGLQRIVCYLYSTRVYQGMTSGHSFPATPITIHIYACSPPLRLREMEVGDDSRQTRLQRAFAE